MTLRDRILTSLPAMSSSTGVDPAAFDTIGAGLRAARAIRLDDRAVRLVNHYNNEIQAEDLPDVIRSARLPWPRLWMESRNDEGRDVGALIEEVPGGWACEVHGEAERRDLPFYPALVRIVTDHADGSYRTEPTAAGRAYMVRSVRDSSQTEVLKEIMELQREQAFSHVRAAAVLSVLLQARGILEERETLALPRQARRRAEREGAQMAREPVSVLDLSKLGQAEHAFHVEGIEPAAEEPAEGGARRPRRTHWVRGHMFMARNRQLTYRRPHLRGAGEAEPVTMRVTASAEEDPSP